MDYLTPTLGKVLKVPCTDGVSVGLRVPRRSRWLTVWECSDPTAIVYVLDTGSTDGSIPDQRRRIYTYPTCVDIRGWQDLAILTDGTADVRVEVTKSSADREREC